MRYLLHSEDATYSESTKKYTFATDKSISNATRLRVSKVSFIHKTAATYPHVVYLRSDALNELIRIKHHAQLKAVGQDNSVNVISTLEETHKEGRFTNISAPMYPINYRHLRNIDIYFTDHDTLLDRGTTGSSGSTYTEVDDDFDMPSNQTKTGHIFRSYDTGGDSSNYADNESINRIYESTAGVNWKIKFLAFTTETNYDKLTIKEVDSNGTESIIVDDHSGGLPSTVDYTSTHSKLKFEWTSDGSNNNIGFDILLYEDDNGNNTLSEDAGVYSITTPSTAGSTLASFFVELQFDTR